MKIKLKVGSVIVNSFTHELWRVTKLNKKTITAVPVTTKVVIYRPTTNWFLYQGQI